MTCQVCADEGRFATMASVAVAEQYDLSRKGHGLRVAHCGLAHGRRLADTPCSPHGGVGVLSIRVEVGTGEFRRRGVPDFDRKFAITMRVVPRGGANANGVGASAERVVLNHG